MAREKLIVTRTVKTVSIGYDKPVSSTVLYLYSYPQDRFELNFSADEGNTEHRFEISCTEEAAVRLAQEILKRHDERERDKCEEGDS